MKKHPAKKKSAKSPKKSLGKKYLNSAKELASKRSSKIIDDGLRMAREARFSSWLSDEQLKSAKKYQRGYWDLPARWRNGKRLASDRITW